MREYQAKAVDLARIVTERRELVERMASGDLAGDWQTCLDACLFLSLEILNGETTASAKKRRYIDRHNLAAGVFSFLMSHPDVVADLYAEQRRIAGDLEAITNQLRN